MTRNDADARRRAGKWEPNHGSGGARTAAKRFESAHHFPAPKLLALTKLQDITAREIDNREGTP